VFTIKKGLIRQRGFSSIEIMVGAVVAGILLTGIYKLFVNNNFETLKLSRKIDARNQLTLTTKKLDWAVTRAGIGLAGAPAMYRTNSLGTDTFFVYMNEDMLNTRLSSNYNVSQSQISVVDPCTFDFARFVAVVGPNGGEIAQRTSQSVGGASVLVFTHALSQNYDAATTKVYPATRYKFYTDQEHDQLVMVVDYSPRSVGSQVRNFQISFKDAIGTSTESSSQAKSVTFSLTGMFAPVHEGAIANIVYSTTAIPRNLL
jgi:Tfp pilus assembly protein PilV